MILKLALIVIAALAGALASDFETQTVAQLISNQDSQTNISLVSECISLAGFTEYDKNIKSIQLYHPNPCIKLYPTYDCTNISMRIQTQVPLILADNGKSVSSLGWCDANECPPELGLASKSSTLRVAPHYMDASDFIIEVHPSECIKFPKLLESHIVSLSEPHSLPDPDGCIELYQENDCKRDEKPSLRLSLNSYVRTKEYELSSLSLCDFNCRSNTTIYRFVFPDHGKDNASDGIPAWKIVLTLLISLGVTCSIAFFLIKAFCMKKVTRIVRQRIRTVPNNNCSDDEKGDI